LEKLAERIFIGLSGVRGRFIVLAVDGTVAQALIVTMRLDVEPDFSNSGWV